MKKNKELVFISTPITNAIYEDTGHFNTQMAAQINLIAGKIRRKGYEVFLAIEEEGWGKAIAVPEVCTPRDYQKLMEAKCLVVYLTDCFSQGTLVEIGWATAREIPVTIICPGGMKVSPLIEGLNMIGDNRIYYIDYQTPEDIDVVLSERL